MSETPDQTEPEENQVERSELEFGAEVEIEEAGFSFKPILGFELEVDGSVYLYSDDGNIEVSLVGGELQDNISIAELNGELASEFMENFDEFQLNEAGTRTIQDITGFLNEIRFVNAEEEGRGYALICSPHLNQFFFILVISSADHWEQQGQVVFEQLTSQVHFYPKFKPEEEDKEQDEHPDLTVEIFKDVHVEDEFVLHVERGDVSLLLAAHAIDPNSLVTLTEVYAPGDQPIYQYDPLSGNLESSICSKPIIGDHGELCFFFPRDTQHTLQPGDYRFTFATEAGTRLEEIQAIIRAGRALDCQAVDLNFWITAEDDVFIDAEATHDFLDALRTELKKHLSPLSFEPGAFDWIQAAPDEIAAFSTIQADQDLADCSYMITETVTNLRALNVGIVQRIIKQQGDQEVELNAVSAGIPGMILNPASPHACVLLSWSALGENISLFARTLIEQLVIFSGIDNPLEKDQPLALNREIAWRLRRHPLFYDAE
jgi:hypothetical protein